MFEFPESSDAPEDSAEEDQVKNDTDNNPDEADLNPYEEDLEPDKRYPDAPDFNPYEDDLDPDERDPDAQINPYEGDLLPGERYPDDPDFNPYEEDLLPDERYPDDPDFNPYEEELLPDERYSDDHDFNPYEEELERILEEKIDASEDVETVKITLEPLIVPDIEDKIPPLNSLGAESNDNQGEILKQGEEHKGSETLKLYSEKSDTAREKLPEEISDLSKELGYFSKTTDIQQHFNTPLEPSSEKKEPIEINDQLIEELLILTKKLGHFPMLKEIRSLKRYDIDYQIKKAGGLKKLRPLFDQTIRKRGRKLNLERPPMQKKRAEIENLIEQNIADWENLNYEMEKLVSKLGYLPNANDIQKRLKRGDLDYKIKKFGGYKVVIPKIKQIMTERGIKFSMEDRNIDDFIKKNPEEWDLLCKEILNIAKKLGHLPNTKDIRKDLKRIDVDSKIKRFGGYKEVISRIKPLVNDSKIVINRDFSNFEELSISLKKIINTEFNGEFPPYRELIAKGHYDLEYAIQKFGGHYKVAKELGFEYGHKPANYWKVWQNLNDELDDFIEELGGNFPRRKDWEKYERWDLYSAIIEYYGGINAVRIRKGFELDDWGEKTSYYRKRGEKTEEIIVETLREYAYMCGFHFSDEKQTKVGPGHRLELVCGKDKLIGFDVTRSDTRRGVEFHWTRKEYHKYLETYIIIVVSRHFTDETFERWNIESPENVIVVDYRKFERFINGLFSIDVPFKFPFKKRLKLDALAECTYDNRDDIKKKFKQKKAQKSIKEFH